MRNQKLCKMPKPLPEQKCNSPCSLEVDMSNMLIPEMPLSYSPSLAIELGSTEAAVFLQQLHFWLTVSQHHHEGKTWVYNTQDQCVALMRGTVSKSTVKRIVKGLRDRELIITMSLHNNKWNHTNFFTINYEKLGSLGLNYTANAYVPDWLKMNQSNSSNCTNRVDQNEPIDQVKVEQSLQNITTEDNKQNITDVQFEEFWKTVPNKDGKKPALAAFKKAIKKISLEDLIVAYKANVLVCESQNRFKKNPATWLNQECWNDESIQAAIQRLKNPQPVQAPQNLKTVKGAW